MRRGRAPGRGAPKPDSGPRVGIPLSPTRRIWARRGPPPPLPVCSGFLTAVSMETGGGSKVASANQTGQAKMDVQKEDDVLLVDEKFDFDLSLSSSSANEDDEVFLGPVGPQGMHPASPQLHSHTPAQPPPPAPGTPCAWSPLSGEKFVEVYKEAHLLALQLESSCRNTAIQAARSEEPRSPSVEKFVQESKLKISLFEKEKEMKKSPKSLKRETYHLSDSPLVGPLLSGVQPPTPVQAGLTEMLGPLLSSCPPPEESRAPHPATQAMTQMKISSKLQLPRTASGRGRSTRLAAEKPKKEISASPSRMKTLNEKGLHRGELPGRPSPVLDVARPTRRTHSIPGKRSLPVPDKVGLKRTVLKPPGGDGSLLRKSSSSGSGSAASVESRGCASPAASRGKSSELSSIPARSSRPLSNTSKSGRMGFALAQRSEPAGPAGASSRPAKGTATWWATEQREAQPEAHATASLPQPQTPGGGGSRLDPDSVSSQSSQPSKAGSIRRQDSCLNSKAKAVPTPTNQFKVPKVSTGEPPDSATPRCSRAQRLQSCSSYGQAMGHSTPARRSQSLLRTPVSTRRLSALPTPASRRLSGLALTTPKTMPRALASPLCVPARRLSSEPRRRSAGRVEARERDREVGSGQAALSPTRSISPPSTVPQALNFSPDKSDCVSKSRSMEAGLEEAKPGEGRPPEGLLIDLKLDQLSITPKAESQPLTDLPLIDFGNTPEATGPRGSENRPLIDLLVNTPDTGTGAALKPLRVPGQLIDLGSPLIQLSPAADKENVDSPLLKF